jgi:hypothetical protein
MPAGSNASQINVVTQSNDPGAKAVESPKIYGSLPSSSRCIERESVPEHLNYILPVICLSKENRATAIDAARSDPQS